MAVCPFNKTCTKERIIQSNSSTKTVIRETFSPCEGANCLAYDIKKNACRLIEASLDKKKKDKPDFSALYPSENPFCSYGLG